jgi:diguanylate cyclase (GGDEF)-like protein
MNDRLEAAGARRVAALDRDAALADRGAGATERSQSARDRDAALTDRGAGATERGNADLDRDAALADRGAGATERSNADLDRDAALADRGAGASERDEAELDRDIALVNRSASARERARSSLDDLTGAYARGAGLIELEREMIRARRTQQPLVLAFIDVDGLKAVNDSHGHAAGDRMLREVAQTLRENLRAEDLIVRYGGDEFVCVVSGLSLAMTTARFELVSTALRLAPEHGSVTVGFAELQPGDAREELVARADAMLYRQRGQQRRNGT